MNRYFIFLMFISLYAYNTFPVISQTAKEGEKLKEQINTKKNTTVINKNDIMYKYRKDFDWIFNSLNAQQKNHAYELQCNCSPEMEKLLGEQFYKTEYEAENAIAEQRALCLAKTAKIMAAYHYEVYIAKKGQKYDEKTQQELEQEAYNKTFKEAKKSWGNVSYLVNGEFEKELEKKIDASLPKEIYEVYPYEKGPNYQETLNNISNGKTHREDKCPVCLDSYQEIGKRVNLHCKHDICASCLYKNKYQWNRHTCPICTGNIPNADFPAEYLKKHIN